LPREGQEPGEGPVYPYTSGHDREALQGTRAWLQTNAATSDGVVMDDTNERTLLDASHTASDVRWLDRLTADLAERTTAIGETIAEGKYASAGQLIRNVDTRTVLVCGYPDQRLEEPYGLQGFALAPGSLMSLLPRISQDDRDISLKDD